MCDEHRYTLHIDDSRAGETIPFPEFPDLNVVYVSSENQLCPSRYDANIKCISAGELKLVLRVDGQDITLSDQDTKRGNEVIVGDYSFMGEGVFIIGHSRNFTYLVITVCRNIGATIPSKPARIPILPIIKPLPIEVTPLVYNAGQPFIIEMYENVTTGYSWELELPVNITLITDASTAPRRQDRVVGAGGVHTFVLKGSRPGRGTIRAIHKHPWEKRTVVTNPNDLKTYDVVIV